MSDPETGGPWTAFVFRCTLVNSDTPEYKEEKRLLDEAGYQSRVAWYGQTQHKTRERRKRQSRTLQKLNARNPKANWCGRVGYDVL